MADPKYSEGISSHQLDKSWKSATANVKESKLNDKDPAAGKGKPMTGKKKAVY